MAYLVEKNEKKCEALTTDLYNFDTNFSESESAPGSIAEIVKSEFELFAALKITLKNNFRKAFAQLLLLLNSFGNFDFEIDFYLLTLMPVLDVTGDQNLKMFLFETDLRIHKHIFEVELNSYLGKLEQFHYVHL